jgi:aspartokinase-like uncharacterized kinase
MYDYAHDAPPPDRGREVERRKTPFVPDHDRIVYPVDHVTSQRAALAKFQAEIRIVVGGQLTRRMVREAADVEDEIRDRAHDAAHYTLMAQSLATYMADAIEVRHRYMCPDEEQRGWR